MVRNNIFCVISVHSQLTLNQLQLALSQRRPRQQPSHVHVSDVPRWRARHLILCLPEQAQQPSWRHCWCDPGCGIWSNGLSPWFLCPLRGRDYLLYLRAVAWRHPVWLGFWGFHEHLNILAHPFCHGNIPRSVAWNLRGWHDLTFLRSFPDRTSPVRAAVKRKQSSSNLNSDPLKLEWWDTACAI